MQFNLILYIATYYIYFNLVIIKLFTMTNVFMSNTARAGSSQGRTAGCFVGIYFVRGKISQFEQNDDLQGSTDPSWRK